ncbi:MAG: ribonuclease Y [Phycisphaerales bacterium]|nr:ribonuclease Y [Phycisphaerales bacterium]
MDFMTLAEISMMETVLVAVGAMLIGAAVGVVLLRLTIGGTIRAAHRDATNIRQTAQAEAEAAQQKAELDIERTLKDRREVMEGELEDVRTELRKDQSRLKNREDNLDKKLEKVSDREARLEEQGAALDQQSQELADAQSEVQRQREHVVHRLSEVASMSLEEAKSQLLAEVQERAELEAASVRRAIIEQAESEAKNESREITLMAIQRFAGEHVADGTVRSVKIPSEDVKGRVIGREGRNIRAFERATGVDVLVDDTPGVIAVSCFDPIRRAIAGEALSKLVADGRVHPTRIEEIVATVRKDMEERIRKAGSDAIMEANIRGLHPKIVEAMGKLHFRTSFGQNVLRHSIEVAFVSQIIADQLGLDGELARRCGFLHDIGKAMDHEMEGGHPAIGMEFCERHGEKDTAVLNAIGGHHNDIPHETPYTAIVMSADAVSGARPGARRESMEMYVKRLEHLEGIAKGIEQVTEAHAIQAGREVRVIVDAQRADDDMAFSIAEKIAKQVEEEMTFPGEIKVTVLRETRAEATAR